MRRSPFVRCPAAVYFRVSRCCITTKCSIRKSARFSSFRAGGLGFPNSDCRSSSLASILLHRFSFPRALASRNFGLNRTCALCTTTCYTPCPVSLSDKSWNDRLSVLVFFRGFRHDTFTYRLLKAVFQYGHARLLFCAVLLMGARCVPQCCRLAFPPADHPQRWAAKWVPP